MDDFDRAVGAGHESLAILCEIGSNQGRADAVNEAATRGGKPVREALGCQQGVSWTLQVLGNIEVSLEDRGSGRCPPSAGRGWTECSPEPVKPCPRPT